MKLRLALALAFGMLALSVSACQPVQAVLAPQPEVVSREATVAIEAASVEGDLPEELPKDLPLWPGSVVADSVVDDGGSITLVMQTGDDFDAVIAGLGAGLEASGWEAVQTVQEDAASSLEIAGGGYEGVITLTEDGAGTIIEYFLIESAE